MIFFENNYTSKDDVLIQSNFHMKKLKEQEREFLHKQLDEFLNNSQDGIFYVTDTARFHLDVTKVIQKHNDITKAIRKGMK